ncbi:MAG: hypothetical protein Q7S21_03090, partial [archaeon]|nr:hypothetical protein [archaeon]
LILALGFVLRFHPVYIDGYLDPDQAFHIRQAKAFIAEEKVPFRDELSNQGRYYSYAPMYHSILATFSLLTNIQVDVLIFILSALYGIIGILVVFLFARKLFDEKTALYAAFILAVLGLHLIRTAGQSRPDGLALLIIPAILYLLYTQRFLSAILLSIFQILLHPLSTSFMLIVIILWMIFFRFKKINLNYKYFILLILITVIVFIIWLLHLPYPWTDYVSKVSFNSAELSQLSIVSLLYYTKEAWIFALLALIKLKNNLFLKFFFIISLAYALIGVRTSIFLSIPIAILAGFGLSIVFEKVKPYQKIAFVIILMLVLISAMPGFLSKGTYLSVQDREALSWMKDNTSSTAVIFSQWDLGHPITYLAQRITFMDGYFEFAPDVKQRNDEMNILISSSNCSTIKNLVQKNNLNYFFIPTKAINSNTYKFGALEADCEFESMVYASDTTKIIKWN